VCGIVGYVGPRNVVPVLISGLEKLEYRGYDSSGVARVLSGKFEVYRSEGKLSKLKDLLLTEGKATWEPTGPLPAINVGIGHTRWATHGRPTQTNAHPHVAGNICVVHNGIIENYVALRQRLLAEGCKFHSETDTEIAAHLINSHQKDSPSLIEAVRRSTRELVGSYALLVVSSLEPDCIVIARNSTPIIIGLGEGENFVASDFPAILQYTRRMIVIEEGEIAKVDADGVHLEKDGEVVHREPTIITWDAITAEKGGYRHFMLKEIYEQPQVVTDTFRGRIDQANGKVFLDDVALSDEDLQSLKRIVIVGCGTAWHAALVARYFLEEYAQIQVDVDYGSEFRYRHQRLDSSTLFIAISQSGETADTLGSLAVAAEAGARTMAICNVIGSSIPRRTSNLLYTHAGPEISVASTKAFVTQVTAAFLLALRIGAARKVLTPAQITKHLEDLVRLPSYLSTALQFDKQIEKVARKYGRSSNFLFLGRGFLYPIALEGALKLKEISYLHAEGYPAGEMKHGPIALIDEETPVVVVLGHDGVNYEKTMSNMQEVASRGGRIIAITDRETPELTELAWEIIAVGDVARSMLPMTLTVPLQLLAYHVAVYRGTDVDQPRNLAKSVTVE